MNLDETLKKGKAASKLLRISSVDQRNQTLLSLAQKLTSQKSEIFAANQTDLKDLRPDANAAFRDRLLLTEARLQGMQESLKQVASLSDPIGEVVEERKLSNGVQTRRVRSPLGLIFLIFESRPNVAIEAFSLALKSGNGIILRGGKESMHSTGIFYRLMREALQESGLSPDSVIGITDPDHALIEKLLHAKKYIDVVVPRGGERLIEFVVENSKIPIIKNDRGLCHIYVDQDADLEPAELIVENAKKQRPGVCNAMETLLVHEKVASEFLPKLFQRLSGAVNPVTWHVCEKTKALLPESDFVKSASSTSFDTEYLDLEMSCKIVSSLEEAIEHIEEHGSKHSEAILTRNEKAARRFQSEIDAAAVYWNASTRFTDGFELGLGGELGISTQKLHVRGPVGLRELTSVRWIMDGTGQIRK